MKGLLRSFIVHAIVLWGVANYIGGIHYSNNISILLFGALALTLADMLLKPFINLLLLPFNLVTLGTFRWLSSVITLYFATLVVPGFAVVAFKYAGLITTFFIIPPITFSLFGAYVIIGVLVSLFVSIFFWLIH